MPKKLYHTTSLPGMMSILQSHKVEPGSDFVSFSEIPSLSDIAANEVTLVFDAAALQSQLTKVQYTEEWFNEHPEQGAYIAGEGWQEQYTEPEECYELDEESGWEERDDECLDKAWRAAELESFLYKADEREWVSNSEGVGIGFSPQQLKEVLVSDPRQIDAVEGVLDETKFSVPVGARQAGVRTAAAPDRVGAGVMFTDGTRTVSYTHLTLPTTPYV